MEINEKYKSAALEAFGPVPEGLSVPERDDSEMVDWLIEELFPGNLYFTNSLGWLYWSGKYWAHIDQVVILEYLRLAMQKLRKKARKKGMLGEVEKALIRLSSRAKLKTVIEFAQGACFKAAEEFDTNPHIITLQNGVYNFETDELEIFDPKYLSTKIANAKYIKGFTHPDIIKALECVEPDEARWLQICFGQGITGLPNPDDKLVILKGGGQNGKSVIIESVLKAAGDYGVFLPEKTLLASKSDHSTEKMPLRGARIAFLEELPSGAVLPVKRLKDLIGTPQITARGIAKDNVTWDASHTLFVTTNYIPIVEESDTGTWRRLKMLLFKKRFVSSAEEIIDSNDVLGDPTIKTRIPENKSGQLDALMTWMIEGAREFYRAGRIMPKEPQSVVLATRKWRMDSDVLFEFFSTYLETDPNSHIAVGDLHSEFNKFMAENGRPRWSANSLYRRIETHEELSKMHTGHRRYREGSKGLSRPPLELTNPPLASQYSAWSGLRFKK